MTVKRKYVYNVRKYMNMTRLLAQVDVAVDYLSNPSEYIRIHFLTINGKRRRIVTYASGEKGQALRYLHTYISEYVKKKYDSSDASFAYKKGRNILDCLERHRYNDVFLKTDIHAFFDSIRFEHLFEKILRLKTARNNSGKMKTLLMACFFEGRLPIGFVSSPALSDLYLYRLDEALKNETGLVYTRYADDYIISASGKESMVLLTLFKNKLEDGLQSLGLELNRKKTYIRILKQAGDAIHVLGLNLVKSTGSENRITVSDKIIRQISKDLCEMIDESKAEINNNALEDMKRRFNNLTGRIAFVRFASQGSYEKLVRMLQVKSGQNVTLDIKKLKAFLQQS